MTDKPSFLAELKRRNVLRAAALYIGAAWALAQGVSQLSPALGLPDWVTRWFLIAAAIGFPFAMAFSWFYEWTSKGIVRESEVATDASITRETGRRMDRWIFVVMALAIVLLLTNQFVVRKDATTRAVGPAVAAIIDKSIAVLPLANESGDNDQQYFSDGLTEDLITALSQFNGLKVISRNSSFQFRDSKDDSQTIGRKLGVAYLLEGRVRREGGNVRITAELVKAADGSNAWSQNYDRPYGDLFKLQDDITHAVAGELKAQLLPTPGAVVQSDRPPSGDLDAYNAYLRGVFLTRVNTPESWRKAIEQFGAAVAIDPHYAYAQAQSANYSAQLGSAFLTGDEAQQAFAQARTAANKALATDPKLAAAHVARGIVLALADLNWVGAEAEFRLAIQLAPKDGLAVFSLGTMTATLGHPAEAIELTRRALASDPRNTGWSYWLSVYLASLGRFDEAEQVILALIQMQPKAVATHQQLAAIETQRGRFEQALQAAQQEPPGMWQDIALAMARQIGPDRASADAAIKSLVEKHPDSAAYQIAEIYALRRDTDSMFKWLDRSWANRDTGVHRLLYDPFIAPYRNDPRFAAFCAKIGVPTPEQIDAVAAPADAPSAAHAQNASRSEP
ncbi:MAG: tetratricopeptide repeat protein [Proteobacteria bacterium]|nr:tetratricopeptide repeat protein [Pseudomonadota bacterium]